MWKRVEKLLQVRDPDQVELGYNRICSSQIMTTVHLQRNTGPQQMEISEYHTEMFDMNCMVVSPGLSALHVEIDNLNLLG